MGGQCDRVRAGTEHEYSRTSYLTEDNSGCVVRYHVRNAASRANCDSCPPIAARSRNGVLCNGTRDNLYGRTESTCR